MKNFIFAVVLLMGFLLALAAHAEEMSSSSYRITATILSGGGGEYTGASYKAESTMGQPTSLVDTYSTSYNLYTGFWYAFSRGGTPIPPGIFLLLMGG